MRSWPLGHSGAIAIIANPTHNLCSSWRLPSNAHTSGISSHHRALSVTFCVRASMSIFWNGFRPRHPASMVWQNTPRAFPNVVARISRRHSGAKTFLMGHSLGGTLAAISAASESDSIRGLVLLGTPLCFKPESSRFRDALVSLVPVGLLDAAPCPGSLLSHMSAL